MKAVDIVQLFRIGNRRLSVKRFTSAFLPAMTFWKEQMWKGYRTCKFEHVPIRPSCLMAGDNHRRVAFHEPRKADSSILMAAAQRDTYSRYHAFNDWRLFLEPKKDFRNYSPVHSAKFQTGASRRVPIQSRSHTDFAPYLPFEGGDDGYWQGIFLHKKTQFQVIISLIISHGRDYQWRRLLPNLHAFLIKTFPRKSGSPNLLLTTCIMGYNI